ncbi:unnamed protein product [Linum tenue]|uniref:F-box domain-containing protein n=1 Tax=Linum tenue TaxID=586396 RepID=A0AAV0QUR4_9ROSI|nr:unnamed protein product [Linum tenue]
MGDDLLEEVLIRSFPNPRSACRSKPVCKRWNSLISNARFNRRFVSHHRHDDRNGAESPPPRILLSKDEPLPSLLSCFLPVPDGLRSHFIIWDSFKDLLLCEFQKTRGELDRLFLICNPFTKQWVALPSAPEVSEHRRPYVTKEVKLVCEEARNSFDLGDGQLFVYSDFHRFRVLCGYATKEEYYFESRSELHVFCSESREWSRIKGVHLRPRATCLDGKLYWVQHGEEINF